jgi:hypothetical protein
MMRADLVSSLGVMGEGVLPVSESTNWTLGVPMFLEDSTPQHKIPCYEYN